MSLDRPAWGLALGGGAVRGHAHVGAIEALEAAGLRPDYLAGTSAGALVASLLGFGLDAARIAAALVDLKWRSVSRVSLRRSGIFSNRELGDLCEELLGSADLRDAATPLAVVAADIGTGERVLLREGPVSEAVRASSAIPGIFEPVEIGGRMLVDGSIVENVPARAARELGADVVAAISLDSGLDFAAPHRIMEVLVNAFEISVASASSVQLGRDADVVVRPELGPYRHWDTGAAEAIRAEGRRAVRDAIPQIERAIGPR
ncbi:MAG: patatin-like phospholipase family protein [Gemmatimonadota bacterium]|nr:patatin-like phospholipase family protein [Gemmatimonadota bacterium]